MNHDRFDQRAERDAIQQQHYDGDTVSPLPTTPNSTQESAFISPYERATRDKYPWLVTETEVHEKDMEPEEPKAVAGAADINNVRSQWRPSYLKRRVLGCFVAAFILVICAIEGLLAGSKRAQGLGNPNESQHYLWTYGPTGILTILAATFARVSYQTKLLAPWLRMVQQPSAPSKALLVDYLSAFQIVALYKSLRNKDFMVSAATMVSFLIKAMIVISTGLITMTITSVDRDSYTMMIQDEFVNNPVRLTEKNNMPSFIIYGLMGNNLTYPNGMSKDYAFQSVTADTDLVHYTVDGFSNSLECQPANVVLTGARPYVVQMHGRTTMNLTVTSSNCNIQNWVSIKGPSASIKTNETSAGSNFLRFERVQCDESKDEAGRRMLLMFGEMKYTKNPNKNTTTYNGFPTPVLDPELIRSTQLLCVPTYAIERVDVSRNGSNTDSVVRSRRLIGSTARRTLDKVSPWAIMDAYFESFSGYINSGSGISREGAMVEGKSIGTDGASMLLDTQAYRNIKIDQLYDQEFLHTLASSYYRQYAGIMAKLNLMETVSPSRSLEGSATIYQNRLVVRDWAAHVMVGIAVVCLALCIFLLLTVPVGSTLPQHPGTVHGLAALLLHSPDLVARVRGAGAGDEPALREALEGTAFQASILHDSATGHPHFALVDGNKRGDGDSESISSRAKPHHPYVFHPATRIALGIFLVGLIVALELVLRKSDNEKGLGDAGEGTAHYGWTAAPTIIFGSLALLFSVMDFEARSLAPYTMLRRGVSGTDAFMKLDLLDMSVPRALYREIGLGQIAAFATTTAFLVASFFTVFSGTLFRVVELETERNATLLMNTTFKNRIYDSRSAGQLSSLVFMANLSWPDYTFEDLTFPRVLQTQASREKEIAAGTDDSINAIIPALRPKLTCRMYNRDQIRTNHTRNYEYISTEDPLGIQIEGEMGCRHLEKDDRNYTAFFSATTNVSYFGYNVGKNQTASAGACSDNLWVWGHLDHVTGAPDSNASSSSFPVRHVAAFACNETIEVVDANVTFQETSRGLSIKTTPAPHVVPGTARLQDGIEFLTSSVYNYMAEMSRPSLQIDELFLALTRSRLRPVALSDMESPSGDQKLVDAIQFHHRIALAQMLQGTQVLDGQKDAAPWPPGPAGSIDIKGTHEDRNLTTFAATATDARGRRRVVQDVASTRVLQSLLGVALVLGGVLGWAFMRDTAVLAREATSVAGAAALVAGGNLLGTLPPDAEWRSEADLKSALSGGGDGKRTRFWMGWGQVAGEDGTVAVDADGVHEMRFGIFAERLGERGSVEYRGVAVAADTGTRGPYEPVGSDVR